VEAQLADIARVDCRDPAAAALACAAFEAHGYTILDCLVSAEKVQALHREFTGRYARYLEDVEHPETIRVGHRRYQVPLALSGGFADPEVWGHPVVVAIVQQLLDADAILESFGGVVSLGYSLPQHMHRDSAPLFPQVGGMGLPCHALTYSLPMVALDDRVGTTAFWPGSHRLDEAPNELAPHHRPEVPLGSAVLWDFRTWHRGEPNLTDAARPMVYATYSRAWYRDPTGFPRPDMVRLDLDADFLRGVPDDRRALFSHLVALR
jgi:ectoine hydroxylase-related dioxygenase (phytanoyl-CoA dioxygenase family)